MAKLFIPFTDKIKIKNKKEYHHFSTSYSSTTIFFFNLLISPFFFSGLVQVVGKEGHEGGSNQPDRGCSRGRAAGGAWCRAEALIGRKDGAGRSSGGDDDGAGDLPHVHDALTENGENLTRELANDHRSPPFGY